MNKHICIDNLIGAKTRSWRGKNKLLEGLTGRSGDGFQIFGRWIMGEGRLETDKVSSNSNGLPDLLGRNTWRSDIGGP